jgi:D-beta-D-heptose 7-phosphate kinase/D-beta-D-heptose 1-phosphate adenosyltransferase
MTITKHRLESILKRFPKAKIMVVGDIMLDEYLTGTVDRISPEAPIPVVNLVNSKAPDVRLGGAANVFNNIAALGNRKVLLCGMIGDDQNGKAVRKKLACLGIDTSCLIADPGRPTTVKTRIIAHGQQVIRLDREERLPAAPRIQSRIAACITKHAASLDAVIFSDYEKGVITRELLAEVLPVLAARKNLVVAVDPKFSNFRHFKNVTVVVPNRKEASGFMRHEVATERDALAAARYILDNLACECVLIKLGEHGMRLVDRHGGDIAIKTAAEQVYDVTGAGDTVISTLVLARTAGATWEEAARIANVAAGIVIHYIGTSTVTVRQLKSAILHNTFPAP